MENEALLLWYNGPKLETMKKLIPVKWHYKLSNLKRFFIGYKTYSQFGEDKIILDLFKNKQRGTYVDIGAHHPYRYSNTFKLYQKGWSGVAIDPDPNTKRMFAKHRPRDIFFNCGAGKEGKLTYYQFSDPAINSFKKEEADKWMDKDWVKFLGTSMVEVRPLSAILKDVNSIDLLNIDAEGMDQEIMETFDWTKSPKVIVAEGATSYIKNQGYSIVKECGRSTIFLRNDLVGKEIL